MGSSPLMALGVKAMTANYAALQTTGHNIANANVAGYSRQEVLLATAQGQFSGAGFFGKGVDVASVVRTHDEFLTREAASAKALASMDAVRLEQLQRLEAVFPPGETGLGYASQQFLNAMVDLTSRPADAATRQVVMARANDLAQRFRDAGAALDGLQNGVVSDLRVAVSEVNGLARSIADANQRIAALKGLGQPANDLLDERERLISSLSEHLQVTRIEAADGSMSIFIGGGQRLVLGSSADQLSVLPHPSDPSRVTIGLSEGQQLRALDESALGGGGIAGLLRFQNQDLVTGRNLVGQLAAALGGAVNAQQALGLTLQTPLGTVAGPALFAIGAPQALPHASNARDAQGVPLAQVALTVTDPGALQASDYDLREDPAQAGQWLVTRLADGTRFSIASGAVVDGVRIDIGTPPPQPGDRFLLQPVARAANGFGRLLDDPRDLAAASPLLALANPANRGTAAVDAFAVTRAPLPAPGATARISFTDDQGGYSWQLLDAGNSLLASGSGSWQPGQAIPAPPAEINGFTLTLTGVPRSGDVLTVEPTPASAVASSNGNALALLALRDAGLVGGQSVTDAYAQAMATIGVRVQGTRSAAEISGAVASQAETARSAQSGVNLDEEAARLIQFQQSYQAAAKVLQVAQSLFDALLDAANGR
jgi:flagellar hook-associated protein 1